MATKKQKHEAILAKREHRLAEERELGLKAQREGHEQRDNQRRKSQKEKHNKEHSQTNRDLACLLCQDALRVEREQAKNSE